MAYTVFESTNMASTKYAERIFDAICDVAVENGTFGHLEELAEGYSHIYKFVAGVKEGFDVVVVDQPAWTEDECRITNQRKDNFICEANVPFRVRVIKVTDEFALSTEGFEGEPEVKKFVTINEAGKLAVADAPVEGAAMVGEIMRKRTMGKTLVTKIREYGYARMLYTVKVKSLA